jgi:hypothetical protein
MRKLSLIILSCLIFYSAKSQSFNQEKTSLTNFIIRMYKSEPFTGVKVFLDYDNKYLVSIVKLNSSTYNNENTMNRVAEVKAKAQVNQFMNGSYISLESIVTTTATTSKKNSNTITEVSEVIKESSVGYVDNLEHVSTFSDEKEADYKVFVYLRELEKIKKKK